MKKISLFIILFAIQPLVSADGFKDLATPNNWSNSFKRWSKGDGAWNNWNNWGNRQNQGTRNPWEVMTDTATDMAGDMGAEAMGDAVSEVEFEFWVKSNFKAKAWYALDGQSKYNVLNYWKNNVMPFQQNQQNQHYYPEYQQQPAYQNRPHNQQ